MNEDETERPLGVWDSAPVQMASSYLSGLRGQERTRMAALREPATKAALAVQACEAVLTSARLASALHSTAEQRVHITRATDMLETAAPLKGTEAQDTLVALLHEALALVW